MSGFYIPKGGVSVRLLFPPPPGYHYMFDTLRLRPADSIKLVTCTGPSCPFCKAIEQMRQLDAAIAQWESEGGK